MRKDKFGVYSPFKGKVKYIMYSNIDYGNHIYVEYDQCILMYAHLESINVKVGQFVEANELLGIMGSTGYSPSRHLHVSAHSLRAKKLNAQSAIDPTFILKLAPYTICNTKVSNPYNSKYCNPKLDKHEGIDFSGLEDNLIVGWEDKVDPLTIDYLLKKDHPDYYKE